MLKILISMPKMPDDASLGLLQGYALDVLPQGLSPLDALRQAPCDIMLLQNDLAMLGTIKSADPRVEVILLGAAGLDAVEAVRMGAYAVFDDTRISDAIVKCIARVDEQMQVRRETAALEQLLSSKYTFQGIVGRNPNMLEIFSFIRRIAPYYRSVTISGETGTGKERIARAIHDESPVAHHPFVAVNCGAIVRELIESELFGHVKGSFTGAVQDKIGLFEAAGEGTLFLDEIGTLPLEMQPHLLRVLQNGDFRRVGSNKMLRARCRIIAAANVNLHEEVKAGRFREDLYFRLTPLTIHLLPLRERADDIPLLIRYFLERISRKIGKRITGVSRPAQKALNGYHWPGNVRELENILERASILASESFIQLHDLPALESIGGHGHQTAGDLSLEGAIKTHVETVLKVCHGNRSRAARHLGISRRSLLRRLEKYATG